MRRPLALLLPVLLALVLAAPAALASELYAVVDGTTSAGEPTPLTLRAAHAGPVLVRAWRIGRPEALLTAGLGLDRGEQLAFLDPRFTKRSRDQDALLGAANLRPALVGTPLPVPANTPKEIELRLGEPGLYLVVATQGRRAAAVTALVSDLGLVVKRDDARVHVWAVHRRTGRPWPGVEVGLRGAAAGDERTDDDGHALFPSATPTAWIRARTGEHLAFGRTQAWPTPPEGRRVYLHTHQPAYRPGERVEVRGIVRSTGEQGLALDPAVRETAVRLLRPDGNVEAEAKAPVSASMGTFALGLDLPETAPTGDWLVVAEVAGREYEAPLVVDAYRKPAFEVTVRGAAPRLLVGEPTHFDVEAAYYDGGRLGGAKVTWRLMHQRMDQELFPEDELVKLFFGTEREAYRPRPLATGEGVLDAAGRLRIPVTVLETLPSGSLSLQATVQGPDRTAVVGTGRIGLSAQRLLLDLRADRHLYGPEDVARVTVRARHWDGSPAPALGYLTVALAPETDGEETWLANLPFQADERGEAAVDAPLAGAGRYVLRATCGTGLAPERTVRTATIHVWAVGERATPGPVGSTLEVVADRDHYAVGDVARLLVRPAGGARPVLATVERDRLLSASWLVPGEVPPVFELPIEERHVPNVYVTFTSVEAGRVFQTTHVIRIPPRSRLLTTEIRPDAAEIAPGATSGLTIRVTDVEDRPVAGAEVDVAVVDEALHALHAAPTATLEAFFHPPHRNAVTTEDLLAWQSVGWAPLAPAADKAGGGGGRRAAPSAPAEAMPAPSADAGETSDDAARPEPSAEMADGEEEVLEEERSLEGGAAAGRPGMRLEAKNKKGASRLQAERVREDFRSAVFWEPALTTDPDGLVRIDAVRYGDALTRWRVTAHGLDASTRVGTGTASVRTKLDVAASVTLPRFLRAGDRATVPLVLRNLTDEALDAAWHLGIVAPTPDWHHEGTLDLAAHGVHVVERELASEHPENLLVRADVATTIGGDAEQRELPVLPRGIRKVVGRTLFASDGAATLEVAVPVRAEPGSVTCRVALEPGTLQAMASALPYLLEYPYGCTEQTLSRFVPLVAAQEALTALGRTPTQGRASELDAMIAAGVRRLAKLQHVDGGFGWWEHDATDPGMTALVVRGLSRLLAARPEDEAATRIRELAAERLEELVLEDTRALDVTTNASVVLALALTGRRTDVAPPPTAEAPSRSLPPTAQALLLRAAVATGQTPLVATLRGHLDDVAHREAGRLWWSRSETTDPTRWQDDAILATAEVLHALLEAGVRPEVLEDGIRWLLEARAGGDRWRSTRDTAAAVELLAATVQETGDLGTGKTVTLTVAGETLWSGSVTREAAPDGRLVFELPAAALTPGTSVRVDLDCPEGTASAGVALRFHETGPAIAASEAGFRVTRRFFRLASVEREGRVFVERTPVSETLPSGTLVECEVTVETDRMREYVMVTSPHAAGFEPARETGLDVPDRRPATQARKDARDDRTMFFVTRLLPGTHVFRHVLRATHAGAYTALPAMAELMYFPDVRGNGDGELWQITPAGPVGEGR